MPLRYCLLVLQMYCKTVAYPNSVAAVCTPDLPRDVHIVPGACPLCVMARTTKTQMANKSRHSQPKPTAGTRSVSGTCPTWPNEMPNRPRRLRQSGQVAGQAGRGGISGVSNPTGFSNPTYITATNAAAAGRGQHGPTFHGRFGDGVTLSLNLAPMAERTRVRLFDCRAPSSGKVTTACGSALLPPFTV